ncbi:hypothetical protein BBJ28_00015168 [Nothophytophthora sp. Chile5]|nr:hypothetical protein BBJ28_00015168 [Nothophytophthora sp. Chile5]
MDAQESAAVDQAQYTELFRSAYERFLAQGLDPNDAVARALLELQQSALPQVSATAGGTPPSSVEKTAELAAIVSEEDVKMEDASQQQGEENGHDVDMEALKDTSTTPSRAANSVTITSIAPPIATPLNAAVTATKGKSVNATSGGSGNAITASATAPLGTQLENALIHGAEAGDYRVVKRLVYQVFSDPDALNAAFVRSGGDAEVAAMEWWGIDRDQVTRVYALLDTAMADQEALQNTFRNALEMLVTQPWNVCSTWQTPHALRFFLVMLEHPAMFDPDYLNVVGGLCKLFFHVSDDAKALVRAQWVTFFSADELHRLLDILQQAITVCLYGSRKMDLVYAACSVLAELHVVNRERSSGVEPFATYDEFYNDAVNSEVDIVQDYARSIIFWKKRRAATRVARRMEEQERRRLRQQQEGEDGESEEQQQQERESEEQEAEEHMPERMLSEMSFCDFPFVLDAASKSKVLQIDSDLEQRARAQDAVLSRSMLLLDGDPSPYLVLKVRREHIVEDAMQQLVRASSSAETLKKPLKVKFVGEEGIDEGGVQKEFFQILIRQLLDPAFGMFTYDEETRSLWFNSDSLESTMEFELIGTLLALAIYNAVILDVSFPHIVYKKLMSCPLGLDDLELALPELGRGLRQLLSFQGDVEEVYQRNFEYSYEVFGEVKTVELKPGGSAMPVTNANREEYVALYVDYVLNGSVARQYGAFHRGFHQVCNREVLSMFRWEELQLLICGSADLDFEALEEATHYEDGFTEDSECIRDFWVVVHAMPLEDKKNLLRFATGSDRVPIRGLSNLVFVISRNGPDSERLPTAHTCSREKLKERLLLAINQAEGFGLR